jgi:regulatory protein
VAEYVIRGINSARPKGWFELLVDNRPPFFIDAETVFKHSLKIGDTLSETQWYKIRLEADTAWLKYRAMQILSRRMISERDLRRKLSEEKRSKDIREAVISQLKGYGFLDDMQFAASFVRSQMAHGPKSRPYLKKKLFEKGIYDPIATEAMNQQLEDFDEKAAVKAIAEKKYQTVKHLPPQKAKLRVVNFLKSRGFPWSAIRDAIEGIFDDGETARSSEF